MITRDTEAEAWAVAGALLEQLDPAEIESAQQVLGHTESTGQDRMHALHASYRRSGAAGDLEIYPHLWAGVGLVRGGAGRVRARRAATPTGCSAATCCCPGCGPPISTSTTPTRTRGSPRWSRRSARPNWRRRRATPAAHLHCGPDGIFVSCLGGGNGADGPGGIALLDHDTFDGLRAWETDRGDQYLAGGRRELTAAGYGFRA